MEPISIQNNHDLMVSYYDLMHYCFRLDREMMASVLEGEYRNEDDDILGIVVDGELAAATIINSFNMFWNGKPVGMGGIGAVATWPEYRERHFIADILVESLKRMKERGQIFSLLAPFSYPFYGKYGWAYGENFQVIRIAIDDLQCFQNDGFRFKKMAEPDIEALTGLFAKCYSHYNGAVVRTPSEWRFRFSKIAKQGEYAYGLYDAGDRLAGYMVYSIRDGVMYVSDWLYDSYPAKRAILRFALQHRAQVSHMQVKVPMGDTLLHLLKTPRQEIRVHSGMMTRVVDVKEVLAQYPYRSTNLSFTIKVSDPCASWNEAPLTVVVKEGNIGVTPVDEDPGDIDLKTDIGTFSQVLFGFIDWLEAEKQGKVEYNDKGLLERISAAMPTHAAFVTSEF
jgi:predicted acetyltransferase